MASTRRGAVSVEAALVLPLLLALVVGVLEWGRVLAGEVALIQLVRDAASAGARTPGDGTPGPEAAAEARARAALDAAGFDDGAATIDLARRDLTAGVALDLSVSVPYEAVVPLVPVPRQLSARTVALLEEP